MELLFQRFDVNDIWQQVISQNKLKTLMIVGDAYTELVEESKALSVKLSKKEHNEIGCSVHLVMEVKMGGKIRNIRKNIWLEDELLEKYKLSTISSMFHEALIRVEHEDKFLYLRNFFVSEFFVSEFSVRHELERVVEEAFNQVESLFLSELQTNTRVG